MGLRNRQTREALAKVDEEEFAAFLDDVSEIGLTKACEARVWTVGATLNWIRDDDGRLAWYEGALRTKSEALAHETLEIADGSGEAKLMIDTRFKVAGKWYRERYGEKVDVQHGGVVGGLTIVLPELSVEQQAQLVAPVRVERIENVVEDAVVIEGLTDQSEPVLI